MEREVFLAFLAKKLAGKLTPSESVQLQSVIETIEEYREIHDRLLLYSLTDNLVGDPKEKLAGVWKRIETDIVPETKSPVRRMRRLSLVAASVLLLIILYWSLSKEFASRRKGLVTVSAKSRKLDTVLQDGSRIILSERSELSIDLDYGKQTRSLVLKGDAFFDVAKNATIPMIVETGPVDILVKGTAFSVESIQNGKLEIQLLRGSVEVRNHVDPLHKTLLYPGQTLSIAKEGDQDLNFTIGSLPASSPLKIIFGNDTLRFHNQRLDSLVFLLQKKYETKIEIRNETLKSKRFSGMFVSETLQEALAALQFTYPFSFKTADQKTIIE